MLRPVTHRGIVAAAFLFMLLSGAAGVGHQLVWTRRLVDLLGASSETFSRVVGAFFVGLAFGAWLSTRRFLATLPPWQRVACAEVAVALLAIPILCVPQFDFMAALLSSHFAKLLWPLVLVTPPALAMGLAVPWTISAVSAAFPRTGGGRNPRWPVWLYAVNTLGGVSIIPTVLLFLLPRFGLSGASIALICVNLAVAVGAWSLSWGQRGRTIDVLKLEPIQVGGFVRFAAFASGFLVLGFEVVLQHQLAQVTINSLFSSGTVLALVLFSLAVAAALAPMVARRLGERALACALAATVVLALAQPFCLIAMRKGLAILPYELTPIPYVIEVIKLGAVAVLPAMIASGLVFPLLLLRANASARDIGVLLAWNGMGGWLGAELTQAVMAPILGLWTSITFAAAGYGVVLIAATFHRWTKRWVISCGVGVIAFAALASTVAFATRRLPQATINPGERLIEVAVSREGVVATVECGRDDWRMLFNNSYTLGGSRAQFNQERQAHLPLLLHGNVKRVACLGIATGSTIAGAALHTNVQSIDAIELSPTVVAHAGKFFAPYNRNVLKDPRVHVIEDDARWIIAQRPNAYDVVIGDLFLPWRTGEARLFAREHFENVRRSLKPDGIYCQWLPLFQLTRPQFEAIARTFAQVFPNTFLVRGDFYSELPILGLVGGRELARVSWASVSNGCTALRLSGKVTDPLVKHVEGVAMMALGPLPDLGAGPMNTLGNAWLEWDAGRNILGMRTPWFIGVPEAEFVRSIQRGGISSLPESLREAHEAGQFFLTLEIAAKLELPMLEELKQQMNHRMPAPLRNDSQADWRQWPMRVKPEPRNRPHG
jgi:spermidine synthase